MPGVVQKKGAWIQENGYRCQIRVDPAAIRLEVRRIFASGVKNSGELREYSREKGIYNGD